MPLPRFSIIVPLYNHAAYLDSAIASVLAQTCEDFELIVIDDGSTDASLSIAQSIADPRIQVHSQPNQGCAAAIRHGLALASGELIAILNSDDEFTPTRLAACAARLAEDASLMAVFTDIDCIDAQGASTHRLNVSQTATTPLPGEPDLAVETAMTLRLLAGNFLHTASNLVCRRPVIDALGGFRDLRYVQDLEFFLRLAARYRIDVIPEPLLRYRFHGSNTLAENPALSVAEHAFVLACFLRDWRLPELPEAEQASCLAYLLEHLAAYGGGRLLAVYLAGFAIMGTLPEPLETPTRHPEDPLVQIVKAHLEQRLPVDQLEKALSWQAEQTHLWWSRAKALEQRLTFPPTLLGQCGYLASQIKPRLARALAALRARMSAQR